MPTVSVLIPAYKPEHLQLAIASAREQTYQDIEILVGDDTADAKLRPIVEAQAKEDARVKYFHNGFGNGQDNSRALWNLAQGKYIKWLFDDDILMPGSVESLLLALQGHPGTVMAFHERVYIDTNNNVINTPPALIEAGECALLDRRFLANNMVARRDNFIGEPSNIMIDRTSFDDLDDVYDYQKRRLIYLTDVAMYLNCAEHAPLVLVGGYLSGFRRHPGQASNADSPILSAGHFEWELLLRGEVSLGNVDKSVLPSAADAFRNIYSRFVPRFPELVPLLTGVDELYAMPDDPFGSPVYQKNLTNACATVWERFYKQRNIVSPPLTQRALETRAPINTATARKYEIVQKMHQYYRDAFTSDYIFPDCGQLPIDFLRAAIGSHETTRVIEGLLSVQTGLPPNKDIALKLMLVSISQTNMARDRVQKGLQTRLPQPLIDSIKSGLLRVLQLDANQQFIVIAAQLLFCLGEIENMFTLVNSNPSLIERSPTLQKILALTYTFSGEHDLAASLLAPLVAQDRHSLIYLMAMTCHYKQGRLPASPIDFASLHSQCNVAAPPELIWVLVGEATERSVPTAIIACDDAYFFKHALSLIYSLHATNRGALLVHVHLYAPNPSTIATLASLRDQLPELKISATKEEGNWNKDSARVHFACNRFVIASQLLQHFNTPVMVIDADCLFRKNWAEWTEAKGLRGEVIFCDAPYTPFWESIPAGLLYLAPTPAAKHYISEVARFIQHNLVTGKHVWYLDQVALAACFERVLEPSAKRVYQSDADLIDIRHREEALAWVVTTIKNTNGLYSQYKADLLAQYGSIPFSEPNDAFRILGEQQDPVYFLQVGAMDGKSFDPIYPYVTQYGWRGILIEPLPDMMARLKQNYAGAQGLVFENVAISDKEEERPLYRIPVESIVKYNLEDWLKGMSTFSDTKLKDYQQYVVAQPVSCLPLSKVLDKHKLPRVDMFQIDTEGFDYHVFKQFDFSRYRPKVINMEIVNLKQEDIDALHQALLRHRYVYFHHDMDLIALDIDFLNPRLAQQFRA